MTRMTALQMLKDGRALIADRGNWTQGSYARMSRDNEGIYPIGCSSSSPTAVCWCSAGALSKQAYEMDEHGEIFGKSPSHRDAYDHAYSLLTRSVILVTDGQFVSIENYNDSHSHELVLGIWDYAIILAGGSPVVAVGAP